ncbi:Probable metabolite transport protein CsbC [Raoultella terrigena]|uniref:Probable metabolite transport protein CsbC n=1 Tax=Raoultella terrigena TaxID=577 RepID=A0A4U9D7V8_RAOTE|nr:Probable metabolite transport protein CsbC [Raoultella terrigena]
MTFVGIWMLGKIGRRTMTMIGQFGCTACLVFIGAVSYLLPETVNGQPDALRAYMVLVGMLLFLSFQQGALSPVTWLLLSEIFPTRLRGIFMGGAVFSMWIANFMISLFFPILLSWIGLSGTFLSSPGSACLARCSSLNACRKPATAASSRLSTICRTGLIPAKSARPRVRCGPNPRRIRPKPALIQRIPSGPAPGGETGPLSCSPALL